MVSCTAPFLSAPRVQIGYALGGQVVNQNLALPVITPKFCTPPDAAVPREAFFQRWRALEGANFSLDFKLYWPLIVQIFCMPADNCSGR